MEREPSIAPLSASAHHVRITTSRRGHQRRHLTAAVTAPVREEHRVVAAGAPPARNDRPRTARARLFGQDRPEVHRRRTGGPSPRQLLVDVGTDFVAVPADGWPQVDPYAGRR